MTTKILFKIACFLVITCSIIDGYTIPPATNIYVPPPNEFFIPLNQSTYDMIESFEYVIDIMIDQLSPVQSNPNSTTETADFLKSLSKTMNIKFQPNISTACWREMIYIMGNLYDAFKSLIDSQDNASLPNLTKIVTIAPKFSKDCLSKYPIVFSALNNYYKFKSSDQYIYVETIKANEPAIVNNLQFGYLDYLDNDLTQLGNTIGNIFKLIYYGQKQSA